MLNVGPDQIDARRFEQALADARRLPAEERRALLQSALALWRGSALAEFAFDDFAQAEIRRLEELRLVVIGERIDAELELGLHGDVIGELEGLAGEHPLRETFRRQLMLALYRAGRQAEALEVYQDARARFIDELGIEPGPELKQLQGGDSSPRGGAHRVRRARAHGRGGRDRQGSALRSSRARHRPRRSG